MRVTVSTQSKLDGSTVLLVRFHRLGDALLMLPVVEALHRSPAVSSVSILTLREYAPLLARHPAIGSVITVARNGLTLDVSSSEELAFDVVVDTHSYASPAPEAAATLPLIRAPERIGVSLDSPVHPTRLHQPRRQGEHSVQFYRRLVSGIAAGSPGPGALRLTDAELDWARERIPRPLVLLAPGAGKGYKCWSIERFAELGRRLTSRGLALAVFGHTVDLPRVTALAGRLPDVPHFATDSGPQLAALAHQARYVVTNNCGLAHVSAAAGARLVTIHSHNTPSMWRPWGPGHVDVIGTSCYCPTNPTEPGMVDNGVCATSVTVDQVDSAITQLLANP